MARDRLWRPMPWAFRRSRARRSDDAGRRGGSGRSARPLASPPVRAFATTVAALRSPGQRSRPLGEARRPGLGTADPAWVGGPSYRESLSRFPAAPKERSQHSLSRLPGKPVLRAGPAAGPCLGVARGRATLDGRGRPVSSGAAPSREGRPGRPAVTGPARRPPRGPPRSPAKGPPAVGSSASSAGVAALRAVPPRSASTPPRSGAARRSGRLAARSAPPRKTVPRARAITASAGHPAAFRPQRCSAAASDSGLEQNSQCGSRARRSRRRPMGAFQGSTAQ